MSDSEETTTRRFSYSPSKVKDANDRRKREMKALKVLASRLPVLLEKNQITSKDRDAMNKVSTGAIQRCALSSMFCSSLAWGACRMFKAQSGMKNVRTAPFVILGFFAGGLIPLQYTSKHMVVSLMKLDSELGEETRRIFQEHAPDSPFLEAVKSRALRERAAASTNHELQTQFNKSDERTVDEIQHQFTSDENHPVVDKFQHNQFTSDENHDHVDLHDHEIRLDKTLVESENDLTREHEWALPVVSRRSSLWNGVDDGEEEEGEDQKKKKFEMRRNRNRSDINNRSKRDNIPRRRDSWDYDEYLDRIEKNEVERIRRRSREEEGGRGEGRTWADIRRERANKK